MASRMTLFACVLVSLFDVCRAGFETLEKPFTGAQESAWESMASRNQEQQARREKSMASVSSARQKYHNATTSLITAPTAYSSDFYTGSVAPKCNATIQNSYHRVVTNIEEFTITNGETLHPLANEGESVKTLSLTGPTTYTTIVTHALRPGRPWQAYYPDNYQCCMDCYVYFPQVEVYYWPVPESEATCANESKPLVTSQAVLPTGAARTAEARYNALYSNSSLTGPVSTVNADGFTFVSPSVYVAFGDVSAGDACGAVGQKYTSVTLGFAPGVLQTVTSLGQDHYNTALGTRAFDPRNVLCPLDYEPERLFVQQDSLAGIHTYRPRIQIPEDLQNLDPKWKSCVVDDYEGIDPPRQLVPALGFEDDPVATTSVAPVQQPTPAAGTPPLPKETGNGDGKGDDPSSLPVDPQPDPLGGPGSDGVPSPGQGGSDPPKQADPSGKSDDQSPGLQDPERPNDNAGKPAENGQSGSTPPKQPASKKPDAQDPRKPKKNGEKPAPGDMNHDRKPTKATSPNGLPAEVPQELVAPKPAQPAIIVQGQTIKQGTAHVTIDGKPVVYSKGSVYVGSSAAPAPTVGGVPAPVVQPKQEAKPVNLGGFKFTPVIPSGDQNEAAKPAKAEPAVIVQGQTIKQGGPSVTINGNAVGYSGGSLHVGSTAISIPPPAKQGQPPSGPVAIGGTTFTPIAIPPKATNQAVSPAQQNNKARSAIVVKSHTITENGPPATINGKPIFYSGGAVYAAGTKVILPTAQPPTPITVAGFRITPQAAHSNSNRIPPAAVIVAGHTLKEGSPAITLNGAELAYSSGSVYMNGNAAPLSTIIIPPPPSQPATTADNNSAKTPLIIGGLTIYAAPSANEPASTQNPQSDVGQTLHPAGTIGGTPYTTVGASTLPLSTLLHDSAVLGASSRISRPSAPSSGLNGTASAGGGGGGVVAVDSSGGKRLRGLGVVGVVMVGVVVMVVVGG